MVRGHRREAPPADRGDAGALRLHPSPRLGVVGRGHELLLTGPDLDRQRTLSRLRQELFGLESMPDLAGEP